MNTPSLNNEQHRNSTFLKACKVADGAVKFDHNGTSYHLRANFLNDLEGLTVLVNSAFEVFRSEKKIGNATEA